MKKISIAQLNKNLPDFKNTSESKDKIILRWLREWLNVELEAGKIKAGDFMPPKGEIAELLGVSAATVQNAIRYAEDLGYFQSKQRVGTRISGILDASGIGSENKKFQKTDTKKDSAKAEIKNLIVELGLKVGAKLPSSRIIAHSIGTSHNTVRLALETLVLEGFLIQKFYKKREKSWFLHSPIVLSTKEKRFQSSNIVTSRTLCKKLEGELKNYIINNFKIGDRIPTNAQLASIFGVSLKTVNDCLKNLQKTGLVAARRGQYGTFFLGKHIGNEKSEKSIFMTGRKNEAQTQEQPQNFQYAWEKAVIQIKKHIEKKYEVGDKIPTIKEFSAIFSVGTNTIRHAINELCEAGILHTQRGKFGGTYIAELPDDVPETYKWLAFNPKQI